MFVPTADGDSDTAVDFLFRGSVTCRGTTPVRENGFSVFNLDGGNPPFKLLQTQDPDAPFTETKMAPNGTLIGRPRIPGNVRVRIERRANRSLPRH